MGATKPDLKSIFGQAMGFSSLQERAAFLHEACAGDSRLQAEIESLLRADQEAGSFLAERRRGPDGTCDEPAPPERAGARMGPYKLLQEIGEGGMGTVFMAEQTHPVQRKVALKIIKPGMDTRQVIARFEAERQALALMDHPNIARVLDAGTTETGRPYFVMELVKGVPITRFCDAQRLTVKERLELFIPVCQAVQHAHQKGIIHRDLKPSNVMVSLYDGKPVPKVIDFGVAKATGPKLTDRTLYTEFGAVVGTPECMSPEQATLNQLDIDTRSDIYSLGVLLYELLTGTTPLDRMRLQETAMLEVLRVIREEEPPRPSTRLSTTKELAAIAASRRAEPRKLSGLVRGELDWIVMKCLEKDRNRRYETASGLALDLERYLADEPVQACAPSAAYRVWKFSRKHRRLIQIAAAFMILLVLGAAVSAWQAVRATLAGRRAFKAGQQAVAERDRAEASFRMARDAVDRLFTQVSQSPRMKAQAMEPFRKELRQSAREFYERFIREQFDAPAVRYDLGLAYHRLAEIDRQLGDYAAAEESLTKATGVLDALVRARPESAEYKRDLAASYAALGLVYLDTASWKKAEEAYQHALAIQEQLAASHAGVPEYQYSLAKTCSALGVVHNKWDRPETAASYCRQAQNVLNKLVKQYPREPEYRSLLGATLLNLGQVYLTKGWHHEAEPALKESASIYGELVSSQPDVEPECAQSLARARALLGWSYRSSGHAKKAKEEQEQALRTFETLAENHPDVLEYAYDVGRCQIELGRTAKILKQPDLALASYDKAIESIENVVNRGFLLGQSALFNARIGRAGALAERGDHARAALEVQALQRQGDRTIDFYNLACVLAQASAAADRDRRVGPTDRERLKAEYAERAMSYLRRAVAKGARYPRLLKEDRDLDPLRARQDFQKLRAELEAQTRE